MTEKQEKLTPAELLAKHRYEGKLTRRFREKVTAMIRGGTPPRIALRSQGLSPASIRAWQQLADNDMCMDKRAVFWRQIHDLENECISVVANNAQRLTEKDGRVAVDWLSRRDPEHFGRKDELNVGVTIDAGPIFAAIAEAYQSGRLQDGEYRLLEGENVQGSGTGEGSE